ncbi:MAG: hypothetical protein KJ060_16495, partial [Candidatus Hydrogenedentes bacterium]|nr:hypothetical protein [Candidatus Hydrogenedentota bacterium]
MIGRRRFLGYCSGASLSMFLPAISGAASSDAIPEVFPPLPSPKRLLAVPMASDLPLDERVLVTSQPG